MAEDIAAQLRHKHVRTLEVLQTVMDENAALKKKVAELEGNRGVAIDAEERARIAAKARAELTERLAAMELEAQAKDRALLDMQDQLRRRGEAEAEAAQLAALAAELAAAQAAAAAAAQQHEEEMREEASAHARRELALKEGADAAAAEAEQLRAELAALAGHKAALHEAHGTAASDLARLTEQLAEAHATARRWETEAESVGKRERKLKARGAELEREGAAARAAAAALEEESGSLKARVAAQAAQLGSLRAELKALGDAAGMLAMLQRAKKALEGELRGAAERCASLEGALSSTSERAEALAAENEALAEELRRARALHGGSNFGKFVAVKKENEQLKGAVKSVMGSNAKLANQVGKLRRSTQASGGGARRSSSSTDGGGGGGGGMVAAAGGLPLGQPGARGGAGVRPLQESRSSGAQLPAREVMVSKSAQQQHRRRGPEALDG